MNVTRISLDTAKNIFQLHGVDRHDQAVLRKPLRRGQVLVFFAQLPPCLVGFEACAGSHYWARELIKLGHEVRLISPQWVKPYVKGNKNDANDAEAIGEAVGRPHLRFVPVKTTEQQDIFLVHRRRQGLIKERTALMSSAGREGLESPLLGSGVAGVTALGMAVIGRGAWVVRIGFW